MSATSGTNTISSVLVLGNTTKPEYIGVSAPSSSSALPELNLTGLITSSGTVALNAAGNGPNGGTGSIISLAAPGDSFNVLQETFNHGTILIPTGGSVTCNLLYIPNFYLNVVNGNLTCQNAYINVGSPSQVFAGSGTISMGNFVCNNRGTVNIGPAATPFTGRLSVSGSFEVGLGGPVFGFGATNGGETFDQTSGTVQLTGSGDTVVVGAVWHPCSATLCTNMLGGFLSIPNAALDLGFGSNAGGQNDRRTAGQTGLANIYGISMGTTQPGGSQPGNCVGHRMTGGTLNLGAGGN